MWNQDPNLTLKVQREFLLYPDPLRVSLVSPMADQVVLTFTSFVNWILDMNDIDICGFVFNLESHVPPSDLALVIGGSWDGAQ